MSKLHLVFGGRVRIRRASTSRPQRYRLVGLFDSYAEAEEAWRGDAQRTVDDAEMKYVVVHLHRLLEPENPPTVSATNAGPCRLSKTCAIQLHRRPARG